MRKEDGDAEEDSLSEMDDEEEAAAVLAGGKMEVRSFDRSSLLANRSPFGRSCIAVCVESFRPRRISSALDPMNLADIDSSS